MGNSVLLLRVVGGRWLKNVFCHINIYMIYTHKHLFFRGSHMILPHVPLLQILLDGYHSAIPSTKCHFSEAGFLCVISGDGTVQRTGPQIVIYPH